MAAPTRELHGKVACITGASRGIGAAVAKDLANRGADVGFTFPSKNALDPQNSPPLPRQLFITWTPNPNSISSAAAVMSAIRTTNPSVRVHGIAVDLTSPSAPAAVRAAFDAHFPHLDILVHNAGTAQLAPLATTTWESYNHLLDLNLRSPFFLTQIFLPVLRGPARIINLSSLVARTGFAFGPAYAASKAGLEALTRCWAKELGADGTTVNAVAPGIIRTELAERLFGPDDLAEDAGMTPVQRRVGEVEDVVGVVAWLAGEGSRWVSGQVINASGGLAMH